MKKHLMKILSCFIPIKKTRRAFRAKYCNELTSYQKNQSAYNIGRNSYISGDTLIVNPQETTIGKYCSIARGSFIGMGGNHPMNWLSTHPFTYFRDEEHKYGDIITSKDRVLLLDKAKPVHIGNDVWIGIRAIIKDGINIGDGASIGAGSVVTHDVPPYAVVAGVPAKIIRYRFSEEIIKQLLELKWWDYPEDFIATRLPFDNIEKCIEILKENRHLLKGET